jgi:hypothetical protein
LGSDFLVGIMDSCFVHLCPWSLSPNSEFGLRLKDFGWNLGFWLSSVVIRYPSF